MTTATIALANREQLDTLLSELIEHGIEPAVYVDTAGGVGLLAPYGEDGEWDAFSSHPYSTDGDPTGLARQGDIEADVEDANIMLEGNGVDAHVIVLAVAESVAHPGLDRLRFPLAVIHEDRG